MGIEVEIKGRMQGMVWQDSKGLEAIQEQIWRLWDGAESLLRGGGKYGARSLKAKQEANMEEEGPTTNIGIETKGSGKSIGDNKFLVEFPSAKKIEGLVYFMQNLMYRSGVKNSVQWVSCSKFGYRPEVSHQLIRVGQPTGK